MGLPQNEMTSPPLSTVVISLDLGSESFPPLKTKWTPLSMRFLAVYWLKISFLSKAKDMDDQGIMRTFLL